MFSKAKSSSKSAPSTAAPQTPKKAAAPSIISTDMRVVGDLSSEGEIQVDGQVEGDIRAKSLIIGETAAIKGEIIADVIKVHGSITGQIQAASVTLAKSAHMVGDILHENLSIQEGAFLEGHCRRIEKAGASAQPVTGGKDDSKVNLVVDKPSGPAKPDDPKKAAAST